MTTWFTADLHIGHKNILRFSHRPFANVHEMNEALVANINTLVKPDDTLYILGDLAYRAKTSTIRRCCDAIACKDRHLVMGSHDWKYERELRCLFVTVSNLKHIKIQGRDITLCHWAMRKWNKSHYGSWHLYAHSHGGLPPYGNSFDIGVDCSDPSVGWEKYFPASFDQISRIMARRRDCHLLAQTELETS